MKKGGSAALAVLTVVALAQGGRAWSQGAAPKADVVRLTTFPISAADWPMYNHDPAGWRFNPAETTLGPKNVGTLVERWQFPAEGSKETIGVVHATPAAVAEEV